MSFQYLNSYHFNFPRTFELDVLILHPRMALKFPPAGPCEVMKYSYPRDAYGTHKHQPWTFTVSQVIPLY